MSKIYKAIPFKTLFKEVIIKTPLYDRKTGQPDGYEKSLFFKNIGSKKLLEPIVYPDDKWDRMQGFDNYTYVENRELISFKNIKSFIQDALAYIKHRLKINPNYSPRVEKSPEALAAHKYEIKIKAANKFKNSDKDLILTIKSALKRNPEYAPRTEKYIKALADYKASLESVPEAVVVPVKAGRPRIAQTEEERLARKKELKKKHYLANKDKYRENRSKCYYSEAQVKIRADKGITPRLSIMTPEERKVAGKIARAKYYYNNGGKEHNHQVYLKSGYVKKITPDYKYADSKAERASKKAYADRMRLLKAELKMQTLIGKAIVLEKKIKPNSTAL